VGFIDDPGGKAATFFRTLFDLPSPETQDWRDILVARYGADLARGITRNFADGLDAFVAAGGDISRSRAHQIKCPVCLITGQQDVFNTEALLMELAGLITTVETHVVADAGHGVHQDRPEWFAATLGDWLVRH
jgi:pimeloyl-ACP methyl ester carboxylesterase